jgi:hypothetical protein
VDAAVDSVEEVEFEDDALSDDDADSDEDPEPQPATEIAAIRQALMIKILIATS